MFRLTIVDTPGFGDGLEGADAWQVHIYELELCLCFVKLRSWLMLTIFSSDATLCVQI